MTEETPILSVDTGKNGGLLSFSSPQEIVDWATTEIEFWKWLQEKSVRRAPGPALASIGGEYESTLQNIKTSATNWGQSRDKEEWRRNTDSAFARQGRCRKADFGLQFTNCEGR